MVILTTTHWRKSYAYDEEDPGEQSLSEHEHISHTCSGHVRADTSILLHARSPPSRHSPFSLFSILFSPTPSGAFPIMVHFTLFESARRIKYLVRLFQGRPKRGVQARRTYGTSTSKSVPDHALPSPAVDLTSAKVPGKPAGQNELYDDTYYPSAEETRGDEESYCTLKIENTLFKVDSLSPPGVSQANIYV